MATRTKKPPKFKDLAAAGMLDLTETGPLTYRELQRLNSYLPEESFANSQMPDMPGSMVYQPENASQINYTNNPYDKFGESVYDSPLASQFEYENYQDIRGEQQPWYMQLVNGTAKGVLTVGTTFIDGTLGLVAGISTAIAEQRWDGIWDNAITNAMQGVTDWSEEAMPNYYTDEERESPWYTNIFTSNFIGDKFIKNLGFTVGAFYSGGLYSKALSAAKWMPGMVRAGTASAIAAVGEGSIEALNNSRDWYELQKGKLEASHQKDLADYKASFNDRIRQVYSEYEANKGHGMIMDRETGQARDLAAIDRDRKLEALKQEYDQGAKELDSAHELALAKLNEDRAKMGNMDLLLNIPILTFGNIIEFGKLYANGFKTANRTSKIIKKNGAYEAVKGYTQPVVRGAINGLVEGFEEINQKAGAEIPGIYYAADVMNYYKSAKDPDAAQETVSWMKAFGEGILKTYGEEDSWEEFFIGTLTGLLGMPVFGKGNTQQAYIGRDKAVGMAGGLFGEIAEYRERVKRDTEIANAMNERMQSPEFQNYWKHMVRHNKLQSEMDRAVDAGDEFEFKNAEHSQMVNDIALWDNAGKIDDLIQMITDASEVSPENIREIVDRTTKQLQAHPQYQKAVNDVQKKIDDIDKKIEGLKATAEAVMTSDDANSGDPALEEKARTVYNSITDEIKSLQNDRYLAEAELKEAKEKRDLFVGPYVDDNGNPYDEEYIKGKIEENRNDVLDTIKLYRKTKRELDEKTAFKLNSEQLATLTWLKTHKQNWDDRAESMAGDIKGTVVPAILDEVDEELAALNKELNALPESIREETRAKASEINRKVSVLMGIKEQLTEMRSFDNKKFARALAFMPQVSNLLKIAMTKPSVSSKIQNDDIWNYMQRIDDTVKSVEASMEFDLKLNEYLKDQEALDNDMKNSDEESMENYINKRVEEIQEQAKNVKTVSELGRLLKEAGEHHDDIVKGLIKGKNSRVAKLAKKYKELLELRKIGEKILNEEPKDEAHKLGLDTARKTFEAIIENAKSVRDALNKMRAQIKSAQEFIDQLEGEISDPNIKVQKTTEVIVANKLREIIDAYKEAVKSKKQEAKDKEAAKKKKNNDEEEDVDTGDNDSDEENVSDEDDEEVVNDEDDEEVVEDVDDDEEVLEDADDTESEVKDGDYITFRTKGNNTRKKGNEGKKGKTKKDERKDDEDEDEDIDFSKIGKMSKAQALSFLKSLNLKKLSKKTADKVEGLIQQFEKDNKQKNGHEGSDEDEDKSNADNNASAGNDSLANEPRFRNWVYGKYMFDELANSENRKAVYNDHPSAQPLLNLLESLGAFEFVDNANLGILFRDNPNIRIHYVKKKDIDGILLAIEVTDNIRRKVKGLTEVKIGDSRYQFIGALGYAKKDKTAEDNWHVIDKDIDNERGNDNSEYFVSKKYYNRIKHIYSGRMVKSGEVKTKDGSISHDGNSRTLKQVLHGVKPILGIYYHDDVPKIPALPNGDEAVPLNTNNGNPREGSVWLMVQEADGKYYAKAIKVRMFNDSEYDLKEHENAPILKRIKEALSVICDPEASDIDRYEAKYELQEHLLYFPENINILFDGDVVSISGVAWGNNIGKGKSVEEKADTLLKMLQSEDLNLRFQIETSELSESRYLAELLDSDVMTSDLLQARNINASFDLYLNDTETGEPLDESGSDGEDKTGHTGRRGVNVNMHGSTVNIGRSEYTLLDTGRVTKNNKEITDPKIIAQVRLIDQINKGNLNPMEGTNVYLGAYEDGTEFGVKKNRTSHSILEGEKLEEARKKSREHAEKGKRKRMLTTLRTDKEGSEEDDIDSMPAQRGMFDRDEAPNSTNDENNLDEDLEDPNALDDIDSMPAIEGLFTDEEEEEEKPAPKPKSKKKGPPPVTLDLNPEELSTDTKANTTTPVSDSLRAIARSKANRKKITTMMGAKTKKVIFSSMEEFLAFVGDPKNGLSKMTINSQKDFDTLLDHIMNCMF